MSEEHVTQEPQSTGNGAAGAGSTRKSPIATSTVDGNIVRFIFTETGETVECDVSKLSPEVQYQHAKENVRTDGRLSFQKMEDPVKAAEALRQKFARMLTGEMKTARRTNHVVDDLTQALANHYKQDVKYIEDIWYPKYFASKQSGCSVQTTRDKKVRVYGKDVALEKLRNTPAIKAEMDRIAKERGKKANQNVDLAAFAV